MRLLAMVLLTVGLGACGDDAAPAEVKADAEIVGTETIEADTEIVGTETIEPDADASDAETDIVDGPDLRFSLVGSVQIVENYSDGLGDVAGSWILPDLRTGVSPMSYVEQAASGACRVWTRSESACAAPCEPGAVCDVNGTCQALPEAASAGTLTVTGLVVSPLTAQPSGFGYTFTPEPPHDGLFDAGDAITVTAAGGAIAAFTATVAGVADMHVDGTGLVELVDGADTTVSWQPAGDESEIELVLQVGWHGAPPTGIIVCRAADAAGAIVVPAAVIEPFPHLWQIGLFQNPSWIERVSRTIVATAQGPIEVTASSRVNVGVFHPTSDQP